MLVVVKVSFESDSDVESRAQPEQLRLASLSSLLLVAASAVLNRRFRIHVVAVNANAYVSEASPDVTPQEETGHTLLIVHVMWVLMHAEHRMWQQDGMNRGMFVVMSRSDGNSRGAEHASQNSP